MKYGKYTWGQTEAVLNKLGGESVVDRILNNDVIITIEDRFKPQPQPNPPLLVAMPKIFLAAIDRFDVQKHIVVDTSDQSEYKISYVDAAFKADFYGLKEAKQADTTVYPHRTSRNFQYSEARTMLGGPQKIVRMTIGQIDALAKLQPNGEEGYLGGGGRANLFEVMNKNGMPRLVHVRWRGDGWHFYSYSVAYTLGWRADRRVFSGNPLPEPSVA
jgi:hypothetical protein